MASNSPSKEAEESKDGSRLVKEGKAEVFLPNDVFYNPVQQYNRDLTLAVTTQFVKDRLLEMKNNDYGKPTSADYYSSKKSEEIDQSGSDGVKVQEETGENADQPEEKIILKSSPSINDPDLKPGVKYEKGLKIFEGLSASGLRSVRFALELPGVQEIIANDYDRKAVEFIQKNITHNKVDHLVTASCEDAAMVMYQHRRVADRFDLIDIDPYGSPAMFLDASVQAIKDGGLLIVTCTDMSILCGNGPETCYAKYGAVSLKAKFCHEMALRILLKSIQTHANCYSRYIVPLVSISVDFYIRVFVRVYTGQAKVKHTSSNLAYVYHCTGCGTHTLQPIGVKTPLGNDNYKFSAPVGPAVPKKCEHCHFSHHVGGPIYADKIHDVEFIKRTLEGVSENPGQLHTEQRIIGMLNLAMEELPDVPLYYVMDSLCNVIHCTPPLILQVRSALMNAGYRVSMSHAEKNSIKTDAPPSFIWDMMRSWTQLHPVKKSRQRDGSTAKALLSKEPQRVADFTLRDDANPRSRQAKLLRYQANPEKDWGPKVKASRKGNPEVQAEKRYKHQGKRKSKRSLDLKQFPCKKLRQNKCDLGDECCYSHDLPAANHKQDDMSS